MLTRLKHLAANGVCQYDECSRCRDCDDQCPCRGGRWCDLCRAWHSVEGFCGRMTVRRALGFIQSLDNPHWALVNVREKLERMTADAVDGGIVIDNCEVSQAIAHAVNKAITMENGLGGQ